MRTNKNLFYNRSFLITLVLLIVIEMNLSAQNKYSCSFSGISHVTRSNYIVNNNSGNHFESTLKKRWGDSINYFPTNSIYIELLGNYTFYTLNYERIVFQKKKNALNTRIGFGITVFFSHLFAAPFTFTYQRYLANGVYFETGPGINYLYETDARHGGNHLQLSLNVGFRFLVAKRFLLRLCYSPRIPSGENTLGVYTLVPFSIGLSIGGSWGLK